MSGGRAGRLKVHFPTVSRNRYALGVADVLIATFAPIAAGYGW